MSSYYEFSPSSILPEQPRQVFRLAQKVLVNLHTKEPLPNDISHLIVATTCPDMLAPSLGQMINEAFHQTFSKCHTIDMVQGCAGGVSALILGSQLAELNKSKVLVVQADAAKKATSSSSDIYKIFGNGSFACIIEYQDSKKGLLFTMSRQYKGLSELVTVDLGHDADAIIKKEIKHIALDPRKYLGLSVQKLLAIKLLKNAEKFYLEFIQKSGNPDVLILHQVNPLVIQHLKSVFSKYPLEFIDYSEMTGNCGAASVGVALDQIKNLIHGKKVLLCSFGTGGVITAGLWQN
ncbi:MAG: 3-oxoacyl-[acyl-carrier-protein] synthase III C-terminal domain-containing protein [bacterium]|nr:3-oxoacyl-[acyl-carrier-protein] synthase III C-terminal domain-containing protein [bacterium]